MLAGMLMGTEKKGKSARGPQEDAPKKSVYTEHLLVPLDFKQRLERVAQRINQQRKQQGLDKQPAGWFIVQGMEEWLALQEAAPEEA